MLTIKKVTKKLKDYKSIIEIFDVSFPDEEKFPIWFLNTMALRKGFDFTAYYDEETLAGISYTIESETQIFLFYLAVNPAARSKGYGSQILEILKSKNKEVVLNIEPLDENSANFTQRKRRVEFYNKNGFTLSDYKINDGSNIFSVMTTEKELNPETYKKTLSRLFFGLHTPKITK